MQSAVRDSRTMAFLVPLALLVAACSTPAPVATAPVASDSPTLAASLPVDPTPVAGQVQADDVVVAQAIAFSPTAISVAADTPFGLGLDNRDPGVPHGLQVAAPDGTVLARSEIVAGPAQLTLPIPALAAGDYVFSCPVHPNMTGTLTVE